MFTIFTKIAGWFFSGKSPIDALTDVYIKHKDSVIESERLAAEEAKNKRDALIAEQQAAVLIRRETAGFWEMRVLTAIALACFVSHVLLVTLDTNFGWFAESCYERNGRRVCGIPAFPKPFDEWEGAIILSLFGIAAAQRSVMSIAAAIAVRKR